MKQNKLLRRLLAALLVVILTLCSTLPALGAEDDEESPAPAAAEAAAADVDAADGGCTADRPTQRTACSFSFCHGGT